MPTIGRRYRISLNITEISLKLLGSGQDEQVDLQNGRPKSPELQRLGVHLWCQDHQQRWNMSITDWSQDVNNNLAVSLLNFLVELVDNSSHLDFVPYSSFDLSGASLQCTRLLVSALLDLRWQNTISMTPAMMSGWALWTTTFVWPFVLTRHSYLAKLSTSMSEACENRKAATRTAYCSLIHFNLHLSDKLSTTFSTFVCQVAASKKGCHCQLPICQSS